MKRLIILAVLALTQIEAKQNIYPLVVEDKRCMKVLGKFIKWNKDNNPQYQLADGTLRTIKNNWAVIPKAYFKTINNKYKCK